MVIIINSDCHVIITLLFIIFEIYFVESDIKRADRFWYPQQNTIFFLETSYKGGLNSREACSVESAARAHPNRQVEILFTGVPEPKYRNTYLILNSRRNVQFRMINVAEFVEGTPVEMLFTEGYLRKSKYPFVHTSDILRMLLLYKYGGLYLDLDVIVMKPLDDLPKNFVVKEATNRLSNGILAISQDEMGKIFAKLAISELANSYNPKEWGANGPYLLQRTLSKICTTSEPSRMSERTCNGFPVLFPQKFYPVELATQYLENDDKLLSIDAYTHHIANSVVGNMEIPKDSAYTKLAKIYCPETYTFYRANFGQ